jgi:hypothetical protein
VENHDEFKRRMEAEPLTVDDLQSLANFGI